MDNPLHHLHELDDVFETLYKELGRCRENLQADHGSQYRRRLLIREFCTFVEVIAYHFKRFSLYIVQQMVPSIKVAEHFANTTEILAPYLDALSPAEVMMLEECSPVLDENGTPTTKRMFPQMLPNLRFAIAAYLKVVRTGVKIDFSGTGWSAMRVTVGVRNRLTHPKSLQDLFVSDNDIAKMVLANDWLLQTRRDMLREANAVLERTAALTARIQPE